MNTPNNTTVSENENEMTALLSARSITVNGCTMTLSMAGETSMHIRNASFDEATEKPYNFGDPNLCRAFVTAWMGIANGAYALLIPGLHLKKTWAEMRNAPGGVLEHVGYVRGGSSLPEEWANKMLEMPRQDDGWFELEYMAGKLKITREMRNSHYMEGEHDTITFMRNAFYRHVALDIIVSGMSFNAHYYPSGAKYVATVLETVDEPLPVRVEHAALHTAAAIVRRAERGLDQYAARMEEEGKEYVSGMEQITLRTGKTMTKKQAIGKEFLRWIGPVFIGALAISEKNVEKFFGTVGRTKMVLALNDGTYDVSTGNLAG